MNETHQKRGRKKKRNKVNGVSLYLSLSALVARQPDLSGPLHTTKRHKLEEKIKIAI